MNNYQSHATSRRLQRGASLLEGIAYLGVAAIVVIGAIALLNTAFSSANTNQLNSEVTAIQTASRKLFMTTQGNYGATAFTSTLAQANGFPQSLSINTTNNTVTNTWGGNVTVGPAAATATEFTISYTNVPQDVCINALTSSTTGWVNVAVNAAAAVTPPIAPATASAQCNAANNSIDWTSN